MTIRTRSLNRLLRRLSQAGYKQDFTRQVVLPDWWEEGCAQNPDLLDDIEIRVARFLGLPLATVRDANAALLTPSYSGAQLRRVRDVNRDKLGPAIHAAMQIASAVIRCLRDTVPASVKPPSNGLKWREEIEHAGSAVKLEDILRDLWSRGIPVVPIDILPAPSFQGMACVVEGRPLILLGYKHDEPGRVAFFIAHETGHIASGDCAPGQPVVDEEEQIVDDSDIEVRADRYATRVLVGADSVPRLDGEGLQELKFKDIAKRAAQLEQDTGADAGGIIFAWAARTRDYAKATMACKALYLTSGARNRLRHHLLRNVDVETATESDRDLLRGVMPIPEWDEVIN